MRRIEITDDFEAWRSAARRLLRDAVRPDEVLWDDGLATFLPFGSTDAASARSGEVRLPRRFLDVARRVAAHRERDRWSLLYRLAFRIARENRELLEVVVDDDVHRLFELDQQVRRDIHKMHAFVRFTDVDGTYVAWYRPDHRIVRLAAPFFADRFRDMRWSILTPDDSVHWNGEAFAFGAGVARGDGPAGDDLVELWRTYYASMFNPARTNLRKMRADMPSRFWRAMPELRDVPALVSGAGARVGTMIEGGRAARNAASFLPATRDLESLRTAAAACEGCPLHERAARTVFGEGPASARIVLVGEQPGDREDRTGRPFVGPAGEVLDRAIQAAGLERGDVYLTNAVKHFAWIERGKQRIHRTPKSIEVAACRPWLEAELAAIDPELIVALGATASRALMGSTFRLMQDRGRVHQTRGGRSLLATIHPSAVLRADPAARDSWFSLLVADLSVAAERVRALRS